MIELSNYLDLLTVYNQPSTGPIHLEHLSERCDISVLPRHCSVWGCVWTTWDEHNEAIQRLLGGIKLRAITQRRRPALKDWRQPLNARRNQNWWNCFKTNKMAAMKPSYFLSMLRSALLWNIPLRNRNLNRNQEKPSLMQDPSHQLSMPSGNSRVRL